MKNRDFSIYKRISISTISLSFIILSCTKTINVDLPNHIPLPIINSFFCPCNAIKVQLTESSSPYISMPRQIKNATLLLYENGLLVDSLIQDTSGLYVSSVFPQEDFEYTLISTIEGYDQCSTFNKIPKKPVLTSVTFQDSVLIDDDGFYLSKAEIIIDDVGDGKNFYEISLSARYFKDWGIGGVEECIEGLIFSQSKNTDPVLLESGLLPYEYSCLLFSNNLFTGERYALQVYYLDWYPDYNEYDLIINVKSVSEDYYNYQKKIKLYNYSSGTIFSSGDTKIGDPVSLFSNVENGYGIFAAYSFISDTIPKY